MCSTHSSCLTFHLLWDFLCSYRWLCMCHAISLADKPWILIREHALIRWFFGALSNLYHIIWILFIYLPIFIFSRYVYIPSTSGMTCIFHDACLHLPLLLWKAYSGPLCVCFFFIPHSIKCHTYLTQSVLQSFKLTFPSYLYLLWTG